MSTELQDAEETLANALHRVIAVKLEKYLDRPDQAATNEENDELSRLIDDFEAMTDGWPGVGEVVSWMQRQYNKIHCA